MLLFVSATYKKLLLCDKKVVRACAAVGDAQEAEASSVLPVVHGKTCAAAGAMHALHFQHGPRSSNACGTISFLT